MRNNPKSGIKPADLFWVFLVGMAAHMPAGVIFFRGKTGVDGILVFGVLFFGLFGGVAAFSIGLSALSFHDRRVPSPAGRVLLQTLVYCGLAVVLAVILMGLGWLYLNRLPSETASQQMFKTSRAALATFYLGLYAVMAATGFSQAVGIGLARELVQALKLRHRGLRIAAVTAAGTLFGWGWGAFLSLGMALGLEGALGARAWRVVTPEADGGSESRPARSRDALLWTAALIVIGLCLALGGLAAFHFRGIHRFFTP